MALLTCPDCGNQVSSKAAKCPRCGCPVSVMIQEQPNSEKQQNTEQQSVEQSIQEQPQPVEIVNNEEKIIEEQPKVSIQKEEKVAEPFIRQKSAKEKTNNIIVAVAIIILFGIIIVAGRMSENNEKESSYVPSDNNSDITNTETTIPIDSPNIAKIQNSAEATQRLNDFKRKITSSPFEKDAVEIVKVIDNDYAKCVVFLSKIVHYNVTICDDSEENTTFKVGVLYLFDAVSDNLYEFQDGNFHKLDVTQLPHKKDYKKDTKIYYMCDEPEIEFNADIISKYYKNKGYNVGRYFFENPLKISDYTNNGLLIIIASNGSNGVVLMVDMSNIKVNKFEFVGGYEGVVVYNEKYVIIRSMSAYTYKVIDIFSGKEIDNPFWTSGHYSLHAEEGEYDFTVANDGEVSGKWKNKGREYDIHGSVVGDGVIELFKIYIQRKNNRFFEYELNSKTGEFGDYHGYEGSFFDHKAENINPSDIKKTTELFMK